MVWAEPGRVSSALGTEQGGFSALRGRAPALCGNLTDVMPQ